MAKAKNQNLKVKIIQNSPLWRYLPDPDSLNRQGPKLFKTYEEMKEDARIGSLFDDRRNSTHNLPVNITLTGNSNIDDYSKKYLDEANLRKWGFYLLDGALTYGFRPAEIIWEEDRDGLLYIDGLDGHNIQNYYFSSDGTLYYGTKKLDDENKWIIHRNEGDRYNRPYGRAYLKRVYWAYKFKKLGWEFWLQAAEKFSVPSIVVLFDQSDPAKAQEISNTLADLVTQVSSGSGGAMANIKDIRQLSMGGSVQDFEALINACDLQIAYGLTGQALATNVSDTGTQALGTVQERTKNAAYENDARALSYTLNKLIKIAISVNFGEEAPCPVFKFDTEDYASFTEVITAMQNGIAVSKKALYSRYGLPEPEDEEDEITSPSASSQYMMGGAFSFSDQAQKKTLQQRNFRK